MVEYKRREIRSGAAAYRCAFLRSAGGSKAVNDEDYRLVVHSFFDVNCPSLRDRISQQAAL